MSRTCCVVLSFVFVWLFWLPVRPVAGTEASTAEAERSTAGIDKPGARAQRATRMNNSVEGGQDSAAKPEKPPVRAVKPPTVSWCTDYAKAMDIAQREGRMLLIYFYRPGRNPLREKFESQTLTDPLVVKRLRKYVTAKLPTDAKIRVKGKEVVVLKDRAFSNLRGHQGVVILDFAHKKSETYGRVVSAFPFDKGKSYTARQTAVILDLPPGTITQRTLVYAVRIHPDGPASTQGKLCSNLAGEARQHSNHQSRIRLQGHHQWDARFQRINAKLPPGLTAIEVCAESWPGETLVDAAVECVRCWRLSSGHWGAVRAAHPSYGYDMKRGSNGIWYATGIFGKRN